MRRLFLPDHGRLHEARELRSPASLGRIGPDWLKVLSRELRLRLRLRFHRSIDDDRCLPGFAPVGGVGMERRRLLLRFSV
jgi:hypothetical protein